jgi:hypothetical protein
MQMRAVLLLSRRIQLHRARSHRLARARRAPQARRQQIRALRAALQPRRQRTRALRAPLQLLRPALSLRRRMMQTRAALLRFRRAPLIRAQRGRQLPLRALLTKAQLQDSPARQLLAPQVPPTRMLPAAPLARARLLLTRMPLPAQLPRRLQVIRMPPALLTRMAIRPQDRSCLKPHRLFPC